jgi:hypothetical protein
MTPRRIAIAAGLACWSAAPLPALAQPTPLLPPTGVLTGNGPQSYTHSASVTALPSPTLPTDAPPGAFLEVARTAPQGGRTGEAQEALERAETRLLDHPVAPAQIDVPDDTRAVLDIGVARRALARRDRSGAIRAIDEALAASALAARPMPPMPVASAPAATPAPAPPVPAVTYALLPGHWQLDGARCAWVPPDTSLRRVEDRPFVQGHYVYTSGGAENGLGCQAILVPSDAPDAGDLQVGRRVLQAMIAGRE